MEKLGLNEIREVFLSFYESKGHYRHHSFPLIPENDKSLLIINSGMAPLKPYFAGTETPPSKRMTTCQKCIRTGDIDNVGHTARHGTFFEMLGSFSFGDYFKRESLTWGWELITEVLKMPKNRLWASVYEEDDQAYEIWKSLGMPEERIVRLGKDDNFWEIGTGPCGPCSEIYYDRGEEFGCGKPDCRPGCECDRYIEFWNHVFTQFNRDENDNYTDLAHPNIDTGMGLERLACIMQDVDSIFDIDTIKYIRDGVTEKSGLEYGSGALDSDVSVRIITDHIRSLTFMIADGIMPSNEGRGYVLRRLLRRAAKHGRTLGIEGPFLYELADRVIAVSGDAYPELREKREYIRKIISIEEEKFSQTLDQGETILAEYMREAAEAGRSELDAAKAFKLYDTYGFPIELTEEIIAEAGLSVDMDGFNAYMEKQKETARSARGNDDELAWDERETDMELPPTEFSGYEKITDSGTVLAVLDSGEELNLVLDRTPFYAESGGQAADSGVITGDEGFRGAVCDVQKRDGIFYHKIKEYEGSLKAGDHVDARVDNPRRKLTARNHTATHLLQAALRQVLGGHVQQAGSRVTMDTLRFDFTHFQPLTDEELREAEKIVNEKISGFVPVTTAVMGLEEAKQTGANAFFGEKYGSEVRVVSVDSFSRELCGGTHVSNTGELGAFRIISESGVAAGVRRIEAVTGSGIYQRLLDDERIIDTAAAAVKTSPAALAGRAAQMSEEIRALKRELESMKKEAFESQAANMVKDALDIDGVRLLLKKFDDLTISELREISDNIKAETKNLIMVFAAVNSGKVTFMVSITDDLLDRYHAGDMIKRIAGAAGGGGGGKADMAQAGARDPSRIEDAFNVAKGLI